MSKILKKIIKFWHGIFCFQRFSSRFIIDFKFDFSGKRNEIKKKGEIKERRLNQKDSR